MTNPRFRPKRRNALLAQSRRKNIVTPQHHLLRSSSPENLHNTVVRLSLPPRASPSETSRSQAEFKFPSSASAPSSSPSSIALVKPSEQRRKRSPGKVGTLLISGATSDRPSACRMKLLDGGDPRLSRIQPLLIGRVIARQRLEHSVPQQVNSAVADMEDGRERIGALRRP